MIILLVLFSFAAGVVAGCILTKKLVNDYLAKNKPSREAREAMECAALSAYTGTSVTQIKKTKFGELYRATVYFSFELEGGTTRETYVVVEDKTMSSFEFTALVITAINKCKGGV